MARGLRFVDNEFYTPDELKRHETYLKKAKKKNNTEDEAEDDTVMRGTQRLATVSTMEDIFTCGALTISIESCKLPSNVPDWCINPKTFEEMVHSDNPLREHWITAMIEELTGKMSNGEEGFAVVCDISVPAKKGKKLLKVKWVPVAKKAMDGSINTQQFKARLVLCGFAQRHGIDYEETFASTLRSVTIRVFFAVVNRLKLMLCQGDVVKAFTQAEMDYLVYTEMPKGFEEYGKCLQLLMNLEGSKQGAHLWQQMFATAMTDKLKFTRSLIDPCLYTLNCDLGTMIVICWVDDLAIAYSTTRVLEWFKAELSKDIKCTFEPGLKKFVGLEVNQDKAKGTITLTQTEYVDKLFKTWLSESNFKGWKHITPCGTSKEDASKYMAIGTAKTDSEKKINIDRGYLRIVGAIMYAMVYTRPDIAFHTSRLASLMQSPSNEAYEAALGLVKYLHHTRLDGITFGGKLHAVNDGVRMSVPRAWSDSAFGGETRPMGGGYVEIDDGPAAWISRALKFTPLNTCEAEWAQLVAMAKELIFTANIEEDMTGKAPPAPLVLITDNKAAYDVIRNHGATKNTVHVERWMMYVRELYIKGKIDIVLVPTEIMRADDKTKIVDRKKFEYCRKMTMNLKE